jgi:hypothetical protein
MDFAQHYNCIFSQIVILLLSERMNKTLNKLKSTKIAKKLAQVRYLKQKYVHAIKSG